MKRFTVVSLFDTTGYAVEPFTKRGALTYIIDILNVGDRAKNPRASVTLDWDILASVYMIADIGPNLIFGFPPCTDLAVSGSRHFEAKREKNPHFQDEAVALARTVEEVGALTGSPWFVENPVSVLSSLWRKPDLSFHPHEYGGYLPEHDIHPDYPDFIPSRDAYKKLTCYWTGNGFAMPKKKPVPIVHDEEFNFQTQFLGGKSIKTKIIRSATPRGLFEGLAQKYMEAL